MLTASPTSATIEIIAPISSARLKSPAALDDIAARYELRIIRSDPGELSIGGMCGRTSAE